MAWTRLFLTVVGGLLLAPSATRAQELKPYFLVIVDTSGSMDWCAPGQSDCSCHSGNNCGNAFLTNRCGFSSNRIGDAKCALQRIIDGTGDAVLGLMQFEHNCTAACTQPGTGNGLCDGQLVVDIENNNNSLMREWVDGTCQAFGGGKSCSNDFSHELTTGTGTPIGEALFRANQYLRGLVPEGDAWKFPTNPDGFNKAPASPIKGDSQLACRPVSVILLTDGDNSCGQLPVADFNPGTLDLSGPAKDLNTGSLTGSTLATKRFKTYVIGFGTGGNFNPDALNAIAQAGGTDAPGPNRFFSAGNEPELSAALNQIIADSQAPAETCNMMDDDCDGKIDEGLPKYCDKPHGMNTKFTCEHIPETQCDGKDDDCDGKIDEDFPMQCSTCTSKDKEVCDGVDNDCDQKIDEDTSTMVSCGSGRGECEPGSLYCVDGAEVCQGEVGPSKEVCDCKDNDCDGTVDDDEGESICGDGARCVGCECVPFCDTSVEFTPVCPPKLTPAFQDNGECLCIVDACDAKKCAASTLERDGEVACAPNDERVDKCLCNAGKCAAPCDGVLCDSGKTCSPHGGVCVEDSCRGLGCTGDDICDPMSGECVKDACKGVTCDADEVCREGKCEGSCAGVVCGDGKACHSGKCEVDSCAGKACKDGKVCDPAGGKCIEDPCAGKTCKAQQFCSVSSGECEADPCWNVTCPSNQVCSLGECAFGGNAPLTPTRTNDDSRTRLVATGGGGCACSVPGPAHTPAHGRAVWLGLFGLALVLRLGRRRRRAAVRNPTRAALMLLCGLLVLLAAGCRVTPFCVDCGETPASTNLPDGSVVLPDGKVVEPEPEDAATNPPDSGMPGADAAADGGDMKPTCTPKPEICNDEDDDCDFKVDEDTHSKANTCKLLGVCAGTLPVCSAGKFICRYPVKYELAEATCDGKDNDCDGVVDNGFPTLGDNCTIGVGECRVTGSYECNGSGTGVVCLANTIKDPKKELCDGKDNDCDGLIDEPMSKPGKNPSYVDQSDPSVKPEVCDGQDNDCDGLVDEPKTMPGGNPSYVVENVVQVNANLYVYKYEASRVDATATEQGDLGARPCSRSGVLPWTNLTYGEALTACEAAGMELCDVADWFTACKGSSGSCQWSFTPTSGTCNDYQSVANGSNDCNGHDVAAMPGDPDTDALKPTGSMPLCYADFAAGDIFDLSGNAKEWTTDPANSPDQNPLRGGAYNNSPAGLRCDFDFTVGGPDVALPSIGFRCCSDTAP